MAKKDTNVNIVGKIVEALSPLTSEERKRVITASLTLLGEGIPSGEVAGHGDLGGAEASGLPVKAQTWMKQNGISEDELQSVFLLADGSVEVIASDIPGKGKKKKTYNAYVLTGIARLLATGMPNFDDKAARALCVSSGCMDNANHASYLKNKDNEFTGSKEKGWILTTPGLKRGAALVKELNK